MTMLKRLFILCFIPVLGVFARGMPPSFVNVVAVEEKQLTPTMEITGTVISQNDAQVSSEVKGRVTYLAQIGESVQKGGTIAKLDSTRLQIQLLETQASVENAKSRLEFLNSEVKRKQALSKRNLSAANDLEETKSNRDIAEAQVKIALARLKAVQRDLDETNIKAPFDGVVMNRLANVGELISAGQGIVRFVETSKKQVSAFIPIIYSQFIKRGMQLEIKSAMGTIEGIVSGVAAGAERQSQLVEVRLDIEADWPVGLTVKVNIPYGKSVVQTVVPRDALVYRRNGKSIFVVQADGTAKQIPVTILQSDRFWVGVQADINVGDQVIIRGAERLRDGQTVAVKSNNQQLISGVQ